MLPLHFTHVLPLAPHSSFAVPGRQLLPEQQPDAQLAAVHRHVPAMHSCPAPHAAVTPQVQAPEDAHVSADEGEQLMQVDPPAPHVVSARVLQVAPVQQPAGHEVASQLQTPARHR